MRLKVLAFTAIMLIVFTVGCNKKHEPVVTFEPSSAAPAAGHVISEAGEFKTTFTNWVDRLSSMADSTGEAYNSWSEGQISEEEFIAKTQEIYEEMRNLKRESDLKAEFNMTGTYDEQVSYDAVINSYNNAKKNLNDFLYLAPKMSGVQLKEAYVNRVQVNFSENFIVLKTALNNL